MLKKLEFGQRSKANLRTCHIDLQKIMALAINRTNIDFGISQGERPFDLQLQYFLQGKTTLDPRVSSSLKRAKHVTGENTPRPTGQAEAVDIYIYHPDLATRRKLAYDIPSLAYVAGVVQSCAAELYDIDEVEHLIRWGGNWDSDGVILQDQSFDDLPHFELVKPKM